MVIAFIATPRVVEILHSGCTFLIVIHDRTFFSVTSSCPGFTRSKFLLMLLLLDLLRFLGGVALDRSRIKLSKARIVIQGITSFWPLSSVYIEDHEFPGISAEINDPSLGFL